jgi:hypothetical protein
MSLARLQANEKIAPENELSEPFSLEPTTT